MSEWSKEAINCAEELSELSKKHVQEHGAMYQASYHNFIAYVGREADGRYFYWVKSWGVDHGKIYGNSEAEARKKAEDAFY